MRIDYWRRYLRARAYELLRRPDAALAEYRAICATEPDNPRVLNAMGYRHAMRKEWLDAARCFAAALETAPNDAFAWFNLGYAEESRGEYEAAVSAFAKAVELKPALDRAWYGLGMCSAKLGRHAEAVQALTEAATLQPMNGIAWYALGMAHHANRSPEKVSEVVKHLHRFDPIMTRRLIQESGRSDLAHLVQDLIA
jgi:tetratricopeptide (TPR) repeat protein